MSRPSKDAVEAAGRDAVPPQEGEGALAHSVIGSVISGRYRVTKLIASGGVSSVYLGQHIHMMKNVAIKLLDPKAEQLPEFVARFKREAIAGAHVQHPNIASATDFGQLEDGSYFLVLEYVAGETLDRAIAEGPFDAARAVSVVRQITLGLGAAHEVGVVHRDLKPTNIILLRGTNDTVKLIDFGFAKLRLAQVPTIAPPPDEPVMPERLLTAVGVVLGTVAYMAPEVALGMDAVDQRSDLYAVGLILYELLAGRRPFDASDPVRLFLQQRTVAPPAIATRSPGVHVPPALEAVVMKLLEKDPKNRYQSAAELVAALDAAMMTSAFEVVPELPRAPAEPPASDTSSPAPEPRSEPSADGLPPLVEVREGSAWQMRLERAAEQAARLPGVSAVLAAIPNDGRFPRWAYVAFPLLGVALVTIFLALVTRSKNAAEDAALEPAARTEMVEVDGAAAVNREVALEMGGLDAAGWRMSLRNAARRKEWPAASEAVLALVRLDVGAFRDHDVQAAARNTAVGLEDTGGEPTDKFFEALAQKTGTEGLDLLYDIGRFRPGTKAGKRATETLRRPEVMMRASVPLKVLFDFREASCVGKRDLFTRMAEQGDERALFELQALRDADCSPRRDPCCYKESRTLATAIRTLKSRLAPAPTTPVLP